MSEIKQISWIDFQSKLHVAYLSESIKLLWKFDRKLHDSATLLILKQPGIKERKICPLCSDYNSKFNFYGILFGGEETNYDAISYRDENTGNSAIPLILIINFVFHYINKWIIEFYFWQTLCEVGLQVITEDPPFYI